jgi:hypothetical protein
MNSHQIEQMPLSDMRSEMFRYGIFSIPVAALISSFSLGSALAAVPLALPEEIEADAATQVAQQSEPISESVSSLLTEAPPPTQDSSPASSDTKLHSSALLAGKEAGEAGEAGEVLPWTATWDESAKPVLEITQQSDPNPIREGVRSPVVQEEPASRQENRFLQPAPKPLPPAPIETQPVIPTPTPESSPTSPEIEQPNVKIPVRKIQVIDSTVFGPRN